MKETEKVKENKGRQIGSMNLSLWQTGCGESGGSLSSRATKRNWEEVKLSEFRVQWRDRNEDRGGQTVVLENKYITIWNPQPSGCLLSRSWSVFPLSCLKWYQCPLGEGKKKKNWQGGKHSVGRGRRKCPMKDSRPCGTQPQPTPRKRKQVCKPQEDKCATVCQCNHEVHVPHLT